MKFGLTLSGEDVSQELIRPFINLPELCGSGVLKTVIGAVDEITSHPNMVLAQGRNQQLALVIRHDAVIGAVRDEKGGVSSET
jgi:hypothetical protein